MIFARVAVDEFGYAVVAVAKLINKHPVSLSRWRTKPPSPESTELKSQVIDTIRKSL